MILNFDNLKPIVSREDVKQLFDALQSNGAKCYMVGGVVRDALMARAINDIDFSVPYSPDDCEKLLEIANIKSIPTGKKHGTISAIIGDKVFEITSMRKDVETDGRFANVEYCDNIETDAARRDFTINALYCDQDGQVFDPIKSGLNDIENKILRFVGNPQERIEEDYLRILRLFRFFAQLENFTIEYETEIAAFDLASNINTLSAERIWSELKKTLGGIRAIEAVQKLYDCGIWRNIFVCQPNFDAFKRLNENLETDIMARLLALVPLDCNFDFISRLKMSNIEKERFINRKKANSLGAMSLKGIAYYFSKQTAVDLTISIGEKEYSKQISELLVFEVPVFPIKAANLKAMGMNDGPDLGKALKEIEQKWVSQEFEILPTQISEIVSRFEPL